MRQRNQRFLSRTSPIGRATAIALFCLAGTTNACLAQFATPKSAVEQPVTQGQRNPLDQPLPDLEGKVKVDENNIVDLHVNDEDLSNVLQMLSIQSQKSILTSKNVSATVTANLYGVTFYEALDAILHVNGFGYLERGNFIYVYTIDEMKAIAEAQRTKVSKIFKLNYVNATDGAEFCKGLLSEVGQIKTNGKTGAFPGLGDTPIGGEDHAGESIMVVTDYEENVNEIEKMVKEIDTRPVQVLVEATVLQTSLNEANAFGVDFSVIADLSFTNFLDLGGPLNAVDGLLGGSGNPDGGIPALPGDDRGGAVSSKAGNTTGPATAKFGIVWNDVAAFIRVLDEVSDTQIISRPNVLTLNRQPARVLVGRKVGYLNTTSTDTATTQTVEFLDTGTQLYLRPFVSPDGMIRMELKPQVSEAVIRTVTDAGGAAVTIPDEITNEITTNVMVRDGQTIVLGGLFRESTNAARRQVPGLGDLPVIGLAFRGHDDETERSEIMFMITPTIVNDAMIGEQADRAARTVEHIRFGFREGLLPWSREKQTGMRLVKAEELARNGKTAAALSKIQSALSMNHYAADAIALREKLLNKKTSWPNRSTLDEITRGEMQKRTENVQPVARRGSKSSDKTATATAKTTAPKRQPTAAGQPEPRPLSDPFATSPTWQPYPSTAGAEPASEPAFEPSTEPNYEPFEPTTNPTQDPPSRR